MSASPTPAVPAAPARERMVWMDALRGAAILLIVVLHATEMVRSVGVQPSHVVDVFNAAASPFRIPLLMTLSGMLLGGSLRKGAGRYVTGKLRAIAWPYLLWLSILVLVFPSLGLATALRGLWAPNTYLWYLHTLLVCYLLALALRRVPPLATAVGALVLAGAASLLPLPEPLRLADPVRTLLMLTCFFAGHLLMQHLPAVLRVVRRPWVAVAGALCAALIAWVAVQPGTHVTHSPLATVPLLGAIAAGIGVASLLPWSDPFSRWLRWVGRHSIVYYVTHWFFLYWALGPLLGRLLPLGFPVLLVAHVACALAAGGALAWLADRTPVRFLFRL